MSEPSPIPAQVSNVITPSRRPAISSVAAPQQSDVDSQSFRRFENQVAGHDGVLTSQDDALVIKPCLAQERDFYEEAATLPELQQFMPIYFGSLALTGLEGQQAATGTNGPTTLATLAQPSKGPPLTDAICIENLCHGFHRPCVLDVKLGTQLWDDTATLEKKQRMAKMAQNTTSGSIGFRVTGFQVYDAQDDTFLIYHKTFGKSLTKETVLNGLDLFFGIRRDHIPTDNPRVDLRHHAYPLTPKQQKIILDSFMRALTQIRTVISKVEVRMRSASLLFIYEGDRDHFQKAWALEQHDDADRPRKVRKRRSGSYHLPRNLEMPKMDIDHGTATTDSTDFSFDSEMSGVMSEDDIDEDDDDEDDDDDTNQPVKLTELRLIDFAHTRTAKGQGPDDGLLFGLDNLIQSMETLRQEVSLLNARS